MELSHHRAGQGRPLVLLHGTGMHWQAWQPVLPRLEAERDVVAVDLPGFGASPPPPPGVPPGLDSMTELLIEFLDELGLERPHLAGVSLGGLLSLELARRGRAASATALSPAGFTNRVEGIYLRATLRGAYRLAGLVAPRVDRLTRHAWQRRLLIGQFYGHPERVPPADAAGAFRALAGASWFEATVPTLTRDTLPAPARIGVPVTIAWAEHDRLLVRRQALRALRAVPGAQLVLLRGCGHIPTFDDPDQVAEVLLRGSAAG